ncbi:MAG: DUF2652 domain-containing protein [Chloroflexota bacterium]|nr:DUF2652 domain-containing protein [Chloroflexota bacterium]
MTDEQRSRQGYLVLADISGYTAFLTGTELEHAQAIIHELTTLIRERLAPPLRFVKLEGDAVFCYADEAAFPDGERLVELLEACYFDFSNRLENMVRGTTCRCNACASMNSLGLKFIAHFGTYVVQPSGGGDDLAGPDVILVHRLLKNAITKTLGVQAYVFFTDACLQRMPAYFDLPRHTETHKSFGDTGGGIQDLGAALQEMREARRRYVTSAEADFEMHFDLPHPPAVVWQYSVDPIERRRYACSGILEKNPDRTEPNAHGRLGAGASSHCNHGPGVALREYVDWRPFSYYTYRVTASPGLALLGIHSAIETVEFVSREDGGTRMEYRRRLSDRGLFSRLRLRASRPLLRAFFGRLNANLRTILDEDAAALESADPRQPATGN